MRCGVEGYWVGNPRSGKSRCDIHVAGGLDPRRKDQREVGSHGEGLERVWGHKYPSQVQGKGEWGSEDG